jgi:hypothetical protein
MKEFDLFLQPFSPLVFRSGRPFGEADAGGGDSGLGLPLPATLAGTIRAAWCDATGHSRTEPDYLLNRMDVLGPLRCQRDSLGRLAHYLPAPADARLERPLVPGRSAMPRRLDPVALVSDAGCDLPAGLAPMRPPPHHQSLDAVPAWWRAQDVAAWLAARDAPAGWTGRALPDPPLVPRSHTGVDPNRQARTGSLYQSMGVDFSSARPATTQQGLWARVRVGRKDAAACRDMDVRVIDGLQSRVFGRAWRLGADGGAALVEALPEGTAGPDQPFAALAEALDNCGCPADTRIRMMLLTPACYARNGWYPDGLAPPAPADRDQPLEGRLAGMPPGWRLRLLSAAVGPYVPLGRLKASSLRGRQPGSGLQRLAPAGSVYILQVVKQGPPFKWADLQLRSSCRPEYARDGFGLSVYALHP